MTRERNPFGRCLDFKQLPAIGFDDVHIRLRGRVLAVVQVAKDVAADDSDGDRPDQVAERQNRKDLRVQQLLQGQGQGAEAALMEATRVPPSAWRTSQSMMI